MAARRERIRNGRQGAARVRGWHSSRSVILMHLELEGNGLEGDDALSFLMESGCYQQVVEQSLAWLRRQPYNVQAVEALLRAQWRSGDTQGAFHSVDLALRMNPHEPGYRFMRGLLRQTVGMVRDAMQDFEHALREADKPELRNAISCAMRALEDWQIWILRTLLTEDRMFRLAFAIDPGRATASRGFALTHLGQRALATLVELAEPNIDPALGIN
jgi:tetratricopeptide (TPR) repeat protein